MDKDLLDIIKFTATALIAVIGWVFGHYFTSKRDKSNKRRDLTIQHLINAYRTLTHDIAHRTSTKESDDKLELIISEIQLFGSPEQAKMARQLAHDIAEKRDYELDLLINSLRADLRKQLNLEAIDGNVTWLRYGPKPANYK
jgi:hypothetical protein